MPTAIGSSTPMTEHGDQVRPIARERGGVNLIIRTLQESPAPVDIHVAGTCRDVAYAINETPDLFAMNCRAIYVNAGLGVRSGDPGAPEYNVTLDEVAYSHILAAPCPIYWLPCFETMQEPPTNIQQYGTWWDFSQADVLPDLAPQLRAYFDFMLRRDASSNWLTTLAEDNPTYGGRQTERRNMWCTAGLLHSAGYTVTDNGTIVARRTVGKHEMLFDFQPVEIESDVRTGGTTCREPKSATPNRFLFETVNRDAYSTSMRSALQRLLSVFNEGNGAHLTGISG